MTNKGPYVPEPQVPAELRERLEVVMAVLRGELTVSAAAEKLNLSRNHFQTILHKAQAAMIESLSPKEPGRPKVPLREMELQQKVQALERENAQLRGRVETIDRLMEVAGGILRGQVQTRGRSARTKSKSQTPGPSDEGEDPDGAAARLEGARRMRALGLSAPLAAGVVGAAASTVRRWELRARRGEKLRKRRGPLGAPITPELRCEVGALVRKMHGQIGAEALRHSIAGVSRRQAAALKKETLTEIEHERIARLQRIGITESGVVRGLDQVYVSCTDARRTLLIASDAHVPYRTAARGCEHYDARSVAQLIAEDIEQNGAPLVYRIDRARSHRAALVSELLREHEILVLHGPPHYPPYYGQHERQNREHRGWLRALGPIATRDLEPASRDMLDALNTELPRASLGWRTAAQVWRERRTVQLDRRALREEVESRAARLREHLQQRTDVEDLAWRLAIEQALIHRGYLTRQAGGWC